MRTWKKDCLGLAAIVLAGAGAAAWLIPSGNGILAGFGTEGLMTALMFLPCLAWRLAHRADA